MVPRYFKTQEAFDRVQARCRAQVIKLNADPNFKGRTGVRDGMAGCKRTLQKIRDKRLAEAERIIDLMVEKNIIDDPDDLAREALGFAIALVRTGVGVEKTTDKLAAAALVLKYTKAAPATKTEMTLNKAEDFLQALASEANGNSEDNSSKA